MALLFVTISWGMENNQFEWPIKIREQVKEKVKENFSNTVLSTQKFLYTKPFFSAFLAGLGVVSVSPFFPHDELPILRYFITSERIYWRTILLGGLGIKMLAHRSLVNKKVAHSHEGWIFDYTKLLKNKKCF